MSSTIETPVYGGQAVMEGVMMRGKNAYSVAVRDPQENIIIHTEPLNARIYNSFISRTPFLRGLTLLWDALGLGMKSLMFSAEITSQEEAEIDPEAEAPDPSEIFKEPVMIGAVILSLAMSVGLFIALPALIAGLVIQDPANHLLSNVVEGVVKLTLMIGYIGAIGFIPDIKRVYAYHGAEHKTINAFEAGAELTPSSVAKFPLEHPRCGTGFLLTVIIISILLFSIIPPFNSGLLLNLLFRVLSRIILIPVVAGISYEFLRFTATRQNNPFVRMITKPNMALQKLTTREPDHDMLAVAIAAFEQVRNVDIELLAADENNPIDQPLPTAAD